MDDAIHNSAASAASRGLSRREMLGVGGALLLGGGIAAGFRWASGHERGMHAEVFIGKARDYHAEIGRAHV